MIPNTNKAAAKSIIYILTLIVAFSALTTIPLFAHEAHKNQNVEAAAVAEIDNNNENSTESVIEEVEEVDSPLINPDSTIYKVIKYSGKFHIMLLHFPIAFLLGAALIQWYYVIRGKGREIALVMLWFGSLGAVGAAALGWMYAFDSVYFGESENILFWHRWLGTGTATIALLVLLLRKKLGTKGLAIALTICAILVGLAAHYGASLTYGPDFLFEL